MSSLTRRPVLVGIVVGLLVALAGGAYVLARPVTWSAHVNLVVVPRTTSSGTEAASLFDTLSRGQIVATAAEIYQQSRWHSDQPDVAVSAGAVTPSAVLQVEARATSKALAEQVVTGVVRQATPEVEGALNPYVVVNLGPTPPVAQVVGAGRSTLLLVCAVLGLVAGLLTAAAVSRLATLLDRTPAADPA